VEGTTAEKDSQQAKPPSEAAAQSEKGATRFELPTALQNYFITLRAPERLAFLKDFLQAPEVRRGKTIIFLSTCASVDLFHGLLRRIVDKPSKPGKKKDKRLQKDSSEDHCPIEKLHGQMDQIARAKAYDQFCRAGPGDGIVLLATDLAARGVDVESISWVVQFDAPVDPATFVHRIGRAARAGKSGKSLAILLPHEDSYVPFLRQRGVQIADLPSSLAPVAWRSGAKVLTTLGDEAVEAALRPAKRLVETDRTVMLRSSKAFVSFVRAYQEHQLPYVFPFKSMDLGSLAVGFCLLRLPRMKEVLGKKIRGFIQSAVAPIDVPFRDKVQERQRQARLKLKTQEEKAADEDYERAQKEKRKEIAQLEREERTRTEKRKAKRINKEDEWRMLQAEECLAKKARKGKLSTKQFQAKVQKILPGDDSHAEEDSFISEDDSDAEEGEGRRAAKRRRLREDAADALPDHWLKKRKRRRSKRGKAG
jgi:ATP-dependent RNA helicase DDX55/SPB4